MAYFQLVCSNGDHVPPSGPLSMMFYFNKTFKPSLFFSPGWYGPCRDNRFTRTKRTESKSCTHV